MRYFYTHTMLPGITPQISCRHQSKGWLADVQATTHLTVVYLGIDNSLNPWPSSSTHGGTVGETFL